MIGVVGFMAIIFVLGRSAVRRSAGWRVDRRLVGGIDWPGEQRRLRGAVAMPRVVRLALRRAALDNAGDQLVLGWALAVALTPALGLVVGGLSVAIVAAVAVAGLPVLFVVSRRRRRERLIVAVLPDALEAVARSLRSGAALTQAVHEACGVVGGPLEDELGRVGADIERGRGLAAAFDDWGARQPIAEVRLAAAALSFGAEAGGSPAKAIDGLAVSLRDRLALDREVQALAAQARMSGTVIALLPAGFLLASAALDPGVVSYLVASPIGRVCAVAGLGLNGIGLAWMHRLTAGVG